MNGSVNPADPPWPASGYAVADSLDRLLALCAEDPARCGAIPLTERALPGRPISPFATEVGAFHTGGMISIQEITSTPRPRPEVFAYVADFSRVAEWDPGIASARRVAGEGGVGTRYEVEATFVGRLVPMTYEVVEFSPPDRIVLRGAAATLDAVDDIRFEELEGGGTRVVYRADFTLKGPLRFFAPAMRPLFGRLGRRAVGGLGNALNG